MKKNKFGNGLFLILMLIVGCKSTNEPSLGDAKITLNSPGDYIDSVGIELNVKQPLNTVDFKWTNSLSSSQNTNYSIAFSLKSDMSNAVNTNVGNVQQYGLSYQHLDSVLAKLGVPDLQLGTVYWSVNASEKGSSATSNIRILKLFRFLKPLVDIRGNETNTYEVARFIDKTTGKYAVWMTDNLNTMKYSDGTVINQNSMYFGSNIHGDTARVFGGIYSWDAVMKFSHEPVVGDMTSFDYSIYGVSEGMELQGIAPVGWHVPTVGEWYFLYNCAGGIGTGAGKRLKSTNYWLDNGDPSVKGTNELEFNAVGCGWLWTMSPRDGLDLYANLKDVYYWTSSFCKGDGTQNEFKELGDWINYKGACAAELHFDNAMGGMWVRPPERGLSVRCVMNAPAN